MTDTELIAMLRLHATVLVDGHYCALAADRLEEFREIIAGLADRHAGQPEIRELIRRARRVLDSEVASR